MIMKKFKWFMLGSVVVILLGVIFGIVNGGLNLGIDFTGGSLLTVDLGEKYNIEEVRDVLVSLNAADAPVVSSGDTQAIIRLKDVGDQDAKNELVDNIISGLQDKYPNAARAGIDTVGGVASQEMIMNAFLSVLIACVLMLIYIWIRFELFSGIGAVIALIHDVLVMTAVISIFHVQINSSYIAACLTIVGYSINDTIILFDRIRENLGGIRQLTREKSGELVDTSIMETLPRTINTSVTTLIMIVVLYILGVEAIKEFALPLIVGIISGTYSSIFIAAPIWLDFDIRFKHNKVRGKVKAIR